MRHMSILLVMLLMINLTGCGAGGGAVSQTSYEKPDETISGTWWVYDDTVLANGIEGQYGESGDNFYYMKLSTDGYGFTKVNIKDGTTDECLWNPGLQYEDTSTVDVTAADFTEDGIWAAIAVYDETGDVNNSLYQINWAGEVVASMELDMLSGSVDGMNPVAKILTVDENKLVFTTGAQSFMVEDMSIQPLSGTDWVDDLFADESGNVYAVISGDTQTVCPVDFNTLSIGDAVFQSESFGGKFCNSGTNGIIHVYSDKICKIAGLDGSNEESTLVDFSENSITSGSISAAWVLDENTILVLSNNLLSGELELNKMNRTSNNPSSKKTVLYIGTCTQTELSLFAQNAISEFNRNSSDCIIKVKEYEDATSLNLEIASGQGPDIICLGGIDEKSW